MVEIEPVSDAEHTVARAIATVARRVMDWTPEDVHVHFRGEAIVYVLEGDGLPGPDPAIVEAMEQGVAEAIERTVGRPVARPIQRTRLTERSLLVVVRLAGAGPQPARAGVVQPVSGSPGRPSRSDPRTP